MIGSWVTNPGDRQARPTSWMPSPSLAVRGPLAVAGLLPEAELEFLERSSFLGRWRGACKSGEPGSFFTMILGAPPAFREALGDDFVVAAGAPLGLPLPERWCCWACALWDGGGGGAGASGASDTGAVLWAEGEVIEAEEMFEGVGKSTA